MKITKKELMLAGALAHYLEDIEGNDREKMINALTPIYQAVNFKDTEEELLTTPDVEIVDMVVGFINFMVQQAKERE